MKRRDRGFCHHELVTAAEVRQRQLADAYANNKRDSVAYIDESYIAPSAADEKGTPFYLVAAYVAPVRWHRQLREELPDVVGANFWHSTQSHQSPEGRAKIRAFSEYVAEGDEPIIVSMQMPIDPDDTNGEEARRRCFKVMLAVLAAGTHCEALSLVIFEERKFQPQRNADARTIAEARNEGLIPRSMQVLGTSPTYEKLLWLPDVVCFALYQSHIGNRQDYLDPFRARVQTVQL